MDAKRPLGLSRQARLCGSDSKYPLWRSGGLDWIGMGWIGLVRRKCLPAEVPASFQYSILYLPSRSANTFAFSRPGNTRNMGRRIPADCCRFIAHSALTKRRSRWLCPSSWQVNGKHTGRIVRAIEMPAKIRKTLRKGREKGKGSAKIGNKTAKTRELCLMIE